MFLKDTVLHQFTKTKLHTIQLLTDGGDYAEYMLSLKRLSALENKASAMTSLGSHSGGIVNGEEGDH